MQRKTGARPIIVVRKKKQKHDAHHGGAWKVAYADFVTAMMAFFMVMWILGMDQSLRKSIEGYFSNPIGFKKGYSAGKSPMSSGSSPGTVQTTPLKLIVRRQEERELGEASGRIRARLQEAGLQAIGQRIELVKTASGLRIELAEDETGQEFFALASAQMTGTMRKTLEIIASELEPLRNSVILEGHTDAAQYAGLYTNWELSADRANAARRVLEQAGLQPERIVEVRGMADRELRNPDQPLDPRNRRITILLPFTSKVDGDVTTPDPSLGAPPQQPQQPQQPQPSPPVKPAG